MGFAEVLCSTGRENGIERVVFGVLRFVGQWVLAEVKAAVSEIVES